MDTPTISILIALIGCFVGLAGWLSGREKKLTNDAEWKGKVDTKLDHIIGTTGDIPIMKDRLTQVEESSKQAHKRIDEIVKLK